MLVNIVNDRVVVLYIKYCSVFFRKKKNPNLSFFQFSLCGIFLGIEWENVFYYSE